MPNGKTFTIWPIRNLVQRYITSAGPDAVIVDPFANDSKYGTIRNDLNPEFDTQYHLDALEFLRKMPDNSADIVLFDPPYSITQAATLYKKYGKEKLEICVSNMGYWARCKDEVARVIAKNGKVISCGWNTNGAGKGRGFELIELLVVHHGGSKNDTLVTVEIKT
jgi:hypothetical protein